MSDVKDPQRVDVSSYIEIITVKPKVYQKAIRTGEGNAEYSLADLAFRGKKLSQNEAKLADEIRVPVSPTIQYKVNSNVIATPTVPFSLQFIKNVYVDELAIQAFGEQPVLDNCDVGTNIYYDGEITTEYSELGWNTYAVDPAGIYISSAYTFDVPPVIYGNIKFGLATTKARNQQGVILTANPKIEQSYSNTPLGSPTDPPPVNYTLNDRISKHLSDIDIAIEAGNNVFFKFEVHNDTATIANLIINCGSNNQELNIRPGATNTIYISAVTDSNIGIAITAKTIISDKKVYVYNFSLCYELVAEAGDTLCIGQDIAFNGAFNSGLAGWATTGYVGLQGTSAEMSSQCNGSNEDPTITQVHFSGGPITPLDTIILPDDKIKLIADIENISTENAEIYAIVNGKQKGYVLAPNQRRIVTSTNFVGQDGVATATLRVKTYPKTLPNNARKLIAPLGGDDWYAYDLFNKNINILPLKRADNATLMGSYGVVDQYIYTFNNTERGVIRRSNSLDDEIFYTYSFFSDPRHNIASVSKLGDSKLMVLRTVNQETYVDVFDINTSSVIATYNVTVDSQNNLTNLGLTIFAFDAANNSLLLARYDGYQIYKLNLGTGSLNLLIDGITGTINAITSIAVDPTTGLYYIAARPTTSIYEVDGSRLFVNENNIIGIDQFGVIVTRTSLYRGDRSLSGLNTCSNQLDLCESVPINSLTCMAVGERKLIVWVRNELIIRNTTGYKENTILDKYGYVDQIGYNNLFVVYAAEYSENLPLKIQQATPVACLHNRHLNIRCSLNFWE